MKNILFTLAALLGIISISYANQLVITNVVSPPTIVNGTCGVGNNGTIVAGSTSIFGQVNIGGHSTTICPIVYPVILPVALITCIISPMNQAATLTSAWISPPTITGFIIQGNALANSNFAYHCVN